MIREFPDSSGLAGVAGLFGASVLHIFEVELDLAHAKATLHAGRLCPQTVIPPWNFGFSTISAEGSRDGRFLIPVELDGRRITALIDTGSTQTVVARDIAAALGATDERLARGPQGRVVGVGGSVASAGYAFRSLRIGDETYGAPELIVAPRAEPGIDIILGSDFLARHRIWLSYARRRVFIEYGPRPSRP